jgi:hypothetical protein
MIRDVDLHLLYTPRRFVGLFNSALPYGQNCSQRPLSDVVRAFISAGTDGLRDPIFLLGLEVNGHAKSSQGFPVVNYFPSLRTLRAQFKGTFARW